MAGVRARAINIFIRLDDFRDGLRIICAKVGLVSILRFPFLEWVIETCGNSPRKGLFNLWSPSVVLVLLVVLYLKEYSCTLKVLGHVIGDVKVKALALDYCLVYY